MTTPDHHSILAYPEFQLLLQKRRALVWPLLVVMVTAYFALILFIAFDPHALGTPIGNSVISVGILAGLAVILLTFVITFLYVRGANKLQPLIDAIAAKVGETPHA